MLDMLGILDFVLFFAFGVRGGIWDFRDFRLCACFCFCLLENQNTQNLMFGNVGNFGNLEDAGFFCGETFRTLAIFGNLGNDADLGHFVVLGDFGTLGGFRKYVFGWGDLDILDMLEIRGFCCGWGNVGDFGHVGHFGNIGFCSGVEFGFCWMFGRSGIFGNVGTLGGILGMLGNY